MLAQRRDEIVLDDHRVGAARLERRRRLGAAERADRAPASPDSSSPRRRTPDSGTSGAPTQSRRSIRRAAGGSVTSGRRYLQELGERALRDAPLRADALALQIARFEAGDHVGLGHAERLRRIGGAERLGNAGCRRARAAAAASPAP